MHGERADKAMVALAQTAQELVLARVNVQAQQGAVNASVGAKPPAVNSKAGTKPGLEGGVPKAASKKA